MDLYVSCRNENDINFMVDIHGFQEQQDAAEILRSRKLRIGHGFTCNNQDDIININDINGFTFKQ